MATYLPGGTRAGPGLGSVGSADRCWLPARWHAYIADRTVGDGGDDGAENADENPDGDATDESGSGSNGWCPRLPRYGMVLAAEVDALQQN